MPRSASQWQDPVGRRLKLRDLHILATVVEKGSMAKAASQLAMSQPAVSESVAGLEAALRVRLLDRSSRGVEATRYATALLARSRVAFDELRQGMRDIEFLADPTAGEVRVACGDTLAAGLMPAAIDQLSRRHPRIAVRVVQTSAETLEFRELRERRVDLAMARVAASFSDPDLHVERLFEDPHRVVVGAKSRWAKRRSVKLAELADEPWLFASNHVIREMMREAFAACGWELPPERVTSSSILLRNHLLATGRFLTVLPVSVLRYNARRWDLKTLPIDLGVKPRWVAMLTLKNRTPGAVTKLFAEHMRAVASASSRGARA